MMSSSKRPPVPGKEDIFNNYSVDNMSLKNLQGEDGNSSKNKASFNETIMAASYNQADGSDGHEHGVSQESSNSSGGFAHLKWNENFAYLMDDMEGIKLFRTFLQDNQQACLIDFRFACQGLKLKFEDNSKHTSSIVKSIYKKYIKGGFIQLKSSTKKTLVEALKVNNIHENIFDQAREDNDQILESIYYPNFLSSDLYKKYAEYELENSKLSSHSGSSERNISHSYFKKLIEPVNDQSTLSSISFMSEDIQALKEQEHKHSTTRAPYNHPKQPPPNTKNLPKALTTTLSNPHLHTSLVSSDVLSLTSDQLTDDAISFTSSSHDGQEYKTKGSFIKHVQRMEHTNSHQHNHDPINSTSHFLPRTQTLDVSFVQTSNIARNNPPLFAKILTNKLNQLENNNPDNDDGYDGKRDYQMGGSRGDCGMGTRGDYTLGGSRGEYGGGKSNNYMDNLGGRGDIIGGRDHGLTNKMCRRQISSQTAATRLLQMLNKQVGKGVDEDAHDVLDVQCSNIGMSSDLKNASYYSKNNHSLNQAFSHHQSSFMNQSGYSDMGGDGFGDRGDGGSMINVPSSHSSHHSNHPHSTLSLYNSHIDHLKVSSKRILNKPTNPDRPSTTTSSNHSFQQSTHHHPPLHRPFPYKHKNQSDMNDILNDLSNERNRVQSWVESTKAVYPRLRSSNDNSSDKASTFKKSSSNSHSEHSKRHSGRHKQNTHSSNQDKKSDSASTSGVSALQRSTTNKPPFSTTPYTPTNNMNRPLSTQPSYTTTTIDKPTSFATTHRSSTTDRNPSTTIRPPSTVVGYYFWDEPIPYRTTIPSTNITLARFKHILNRKGNFRYFFKHACSDFGGEVVNEEVFDEDQVLPLWEGKVFCKIEPVFTQYNV